MHTHERYHLWWWYVRVCVCASANAEIINNPAQQCNAILSVCQRKLIVYIYSHIYLLLKMIVCVCALAHLFRQQFDLSPFLWMIKSSGQHTYIITFMVWPPNVISVRVFSCVFSYSSHISTITAVELFDGGLQWNSIFCIWYWTRRKNTLFYLCGSHFFVHLFRTHRIFQMNISRPVFRNQSVMSFNRLRMYRTQTFALFCFFVCIVIDLRLKQIPKKIVNSRWIVAINQNGQ